MGPAFRQRLDGVLDGLERELAALLRQARDDGKINARHDPDDTARFIVAAWQGAILRMKAAGQPQPMLLARDMLLGMLRN